VFGAAEAYALTLAQGLHHRGWEVTLIVPKEMRLPPESDSFESQGARFLAVPGTLLRRPLALRSLLRSVGPDLVHVNDVFLPGMAAATVRGAGRTVVTCHTPALGVSYSRRGRALARWSVPRVDAWIALSPRNARLLATRMAVRSGHIRVIPPGLVPDRFEGMSREEARLALGIPLDTFLVGTVGRIAPQKRHDLLIRAGALAASRIPGLAVAVLGDGELLSDMRALGERVLPGRVLFAGHVTNGHRLLPAMDVFCLPSDYEGVSFALLEAMEMGKAIVASDVQGSGEVIDDGVHGLLVPAGRPEPIADAIVRLARDRELAGRLGRHARARFFAEFTAEKMIDQTADLYRQLLASRN
jgi:glycosyltransferase involved in cell wall biosynthesis